jgi:hypothetical protein
MREVDGACAALVADRPLRVRRQRRRRRIAAVGFDPAAEVVAVAAGHCPPLLPGAHDDPLIWIPYYDNSVEEF